MREFAAQGRWDSYWGCFSQRGKGWFIGETFTALAWDAYAQPIDPKQGEGSRKFLEKYGLRKESLQRREEETVDGACRRAAEFLGRRGPDYCKDLFGDRRFPPFPKPGAIRVLEERSDRAVLIFSDDLKCEAVKVDGRWLIDGARFD
jgi:hypothetical protein